MKKTILITLMLAMVMAVVPTGVFAASKTVKSTMYEIYKSKNAVFVGCNNKLFRVKLKNGKPVSKKVLFKCSKKKCIDHLILKGKYVYFKVTQGAASSKVYLYRVKKTGGKAKKLATMKNNPSFVAIKGKKIFYTYYGDETDEDGRILNTYKKVMKLNGSGKKNTDIEAEENDKYYNKKGYKYAFKLNGSKVSYYLKTPKGKILLMKD